jgi:hypothetical protein
MDRCIFCGEEIEGSVKEHLLKYHFAAAPPAIPKPKPLPTEEPKKEMPPAIANDMPKADKHETPAVPLEKPKKRYLSGGEIITLLQNTNKQFHLNEIAGCPLTKENE